MGDIRRGQLVWVCGRSAAFAGLVIGRRGLQLRVRVADHGVLWVDKWRCRRCRLPWSAVRLQLLK